MFATVMVTGAFSLRLLLLDLLGIVVTVCVSSFSHMLFQYCKPWWGSSHSVPLLLSVHLGSFSEKHLLYSPGFYRSGIPLQVASKGFETFLGSFQRLRLGQPAVPLCHPFLHHTFLQLR